MTVEPDAGFEALRTIVEEGDTARIDAILDIFDFSEEIVTEADVATFVARRCHAEDAPTRRLAARAAGYLHDEAGAVTCPPKLLRDSDIAVARAAAMSIGRLRDENAFPLLVESLSRRPLRASVRKAIARFGTDKIESLAARFRRTTGAFTIKASKGSGNSASAHPTCGSPETKRTGSSKEKRHVSRRSRAFAPASRASPPCSKAISWLSPLGREVLAEKVAAVERHLKRVHQKLPGNPGALKPSTDAADAVVLHLWQAVQIAIDVALAACGSGLEHQKALAVGGDVVGATEGVSIVPRRRSQASRPEMLDRSRRGLPSSRPGSADDRRARFRLETRAAPPHRLRRSATSRPGPESAPRTLRLARLIRLIDDPGAIG